MTTARVRVLAALFAVFAAGFALGFWHDRWVATAFAFFALVAASSGFARPPAGKRWRSPCAAFPVQPSGALPLAAAVAPVPGARLERAASSDRGGRSVRAPPPGGSGRSLLEAYRVSGGGAPAGGDWYDAFRLIDGRCVISIGDVAGSGPTAADTMAAVRQAIRGAAHAGAGPVDVLVASDRALPDDAPHRMVTAFVGVLDPVTRLFTYASAGHQPALVRDPTGDVFELDAPGLPLGVGGTKAIEAREVVLVANSLLVLYTDGLVESTRDRTRGDRRLRRAIADEAVMRARDIAAAVFDRVVPGGRSGDDVAVLVVALGHIDEEDRFRHWTFDAIDRFAARETRAAVRRGPSRVRCREPEVADAVSMFGELLANVVLHARGPVTIVLDTSRRPAGTRRSRPRPRRRAGTGSDDERGLRSRPAGSLDRRVACATRSRSGRGPAAEPTPARSCGCSRRRPRAAARCMETAPTLRIDGA